jgi:hypothetical protein
MEPTQISGFVAALDHVLERLRSPAGDAATRLA